MDSIAEYLAKGYSLQGLLLKFCWQQIHKAFAALKLLAHQIAYARHSAIQQHHSSSVFLE